MKITVAGAGYVGLVTSVCLANSGHQVCCIDVNKEIISSLQKGISTIYEEGLDTLLHKSLKKNLFFTQNKKQAYEECELIMICVGTPERSDGSANLEYVYQVCQDIISNITKKCLVVVKSTVPIGTCDQLEKRMNEDLNQEFTIEVASNPEFLAQGTAVKDTLEASRIIIGVESKEAGDLLKQVYEPLNIPIVKMNRKSAEMVKYASNDFLALKISFINDIANLCEIVGANIDDVSLGMSYDNRIGNKFLQAGIGYGGSCFPKDTKALHWLSTMHDYELKTVKAAIEVNQNQKYKLYKKALAEHGDLKGMNIAILGLTFKPNTDDLREAPSIINVQALLEQHAKITAYDPKGMERFKKLFPTLDYASQAVEALKEADLCFIFTEWEEIKNLSVSDFLTQMNTPVVYDGRNCFDPEEMRKAGIQYYSIGR